jgi:hypothetical protein
VIKHKINEQALTKRILDISLQYLDLQRLRLAVRKAELKQKTRKTRPAGSRGNRGKAGPDEANK